MTTARDLIAALGGRWSGNRGTARCPAHSDGTPSLSIADGDHGQPVVHCHAGCDFREIRAELVRQIVDYYREVGWPPRPQGSTPP